MRIGKNSRKRVLSSIATISYKLARESTKRDLACEASLISTAWTYVIPNCAENLNILQGLQKNSELLFRFS